MLRRFAYPFFDVPAATGEPTAVAEAPPPAESESLSDHESQFSPEASDRRPAADAISDAESAPADRDASGRFTPRHRARSQRADADDVSAIAAQTKRLRELEEKLGGDIARLPGESDRVYNLRRRADILERQATAPKPEPAKPAPAPRPPARSAEAIPQTFPSFEEYLAQEGNSDKNLHDYLDARADWRYAVRRSAEREAEAEDARTRTIAERTKRYQASVPAAKQKYPDWDTVVTADAPISPMLSAAILASDQGTDIVYYLGSHPEILAELNDENPEFSPAAVGPLRRYLDALVAPQRSSSSSPRAAAASTGSAPAEPVKPAPRPPNPVRTGVAATTTDDPPGDESSLAAHEKAYGRKAR